MRTELRSKGRALVSGVFCVALVGCAVSRDGLPLTGSGTISLAAAQEVTEGFHSTMTIVLRSLTGLVAGLRKRSGEIVEGYEKVKEGKEDIERGFRGN
jgi:hypothetical protein